MIRRKHRVEQNPRRQLKRAFLLTLVASLALVAAQPATAGKPSFPAASQLCELQGGVFSSFEGFAYSCSGLNPFSEPAGMHATTPLCERASRGSYLTVAGTYLCLL